MHATQALSSVATFVVEKHRRPSRQIGRLFKSSSICQFCERSALSILIASVRKWELRMAREYHVMDVLILYVL